MPEPILSARHLRKVFGGLVAVDDVSLDIENGHVHSIIGPNGAGKTTLMNLLNGVYKPTSGTIIYQGQDITDVPLHRRAHLGIGRSFQITNIFPRLSVLENVRLAAQAVGGISFQFVRSTAAYADLLSRARSVLETVGLGQFAAVPATTLPHGGKRKLELAILLVQQPRLLILDEPTAGMASHEVPDLIGIIEAIRKQGNKTVMVVEHNMQLVMNVSDRITVMHLGNVLAEGRPTEIAANKTVQSAYLGELYSDLVQEARG
jgi:branched-chain amino acid transport system ATP-binding protein